MKTIEITASGVIYTASEKMLPLTVTLKSSDASRKIQISTDGGIEFYDVAIDVETAASLVLTITSPVSAIQALGVAGDRLIILGAG